MAQEKENKQESNNGSKSWEDALSEKSQKTNHENGTGDPIPSDKKGVQLLVDKILQTSVRLPMLEITYDRFLRINSTSLRNYTSGNVDLEIEETKSERFSDCLEKISTPCMLSVFKAIEWDNFGLVVIEAPLIYAFVELLLGGRKITPSLTVEGRPFTSIENSVIKNITEIVLHDLSSAFNPITSATFQLDRIETNPKFAMISRPEDVVIAYNINVNMDTRSGNFHIIFPYSTIEPVKKLLAKPYIGERSAKDPNWARHFESEISKASMKLEVVLNSYVTELKDVASFEVGKTIMLDKMVGCDWNIQLNKQIVSTGQPGKIGDKMAIQLNEPVSFKRYNN